MVATVRLSVLAKSCFSLFRHFGWGFVQSWYFGWLILTKYDKSEAFMPQSEVFSKLNATNATLCGIIARFPLLAA